MIQGSKGNIIYMSEECQGNPKKQTYLLECRPYVDYISKKVCIADPMQTMQTVFVTLVQHVNFIDSLPAINEIDMKMKININLASYLLSYTFGGKLFRSCQTCQTQCSPST